MDEYTVEITEILQKQINIKASSREEALAKVIELYNNCMIILDERDYIDAEFKIR